MKATEIAALAKGFAPVIRDAIEAATAPLKKQIAEQEEKIEQQDERIAELEARPVGLKYLGTFERGTSYAEHDGVTHHGSTWVARRATTSEPGTPDSGWQLAVKRGADGKDLR